MRIVETPSSNVGSALGGSNSGKLYEKILLLTRSPVPELATHMVVSSDQMPCGLLLFASRVKSLSACGAPSASRYA